MALLTARLIGAMIAWSLFAVGGVYLWATTPLMAAAVVLAILRRPTPGSSRQARVLTVLLLLALGGVACQLVPVPTVIRAALSPHADEVRSAIYLGTSAAATVWRPLSIAPSSTGYAAALVVTSLVVFGAARVACAHGMTRRLVRYAACAGLLAACVAIVLQAAGDRTLIYGTWHALDAGARPFGPFVNRNHFATWVLMAIPLSAGYVASEVASARPVHGAAARLAGAFEWLGTSGAWVAVSGIVMTLALAMSVSRSGLVAFVTALVFGAWAARRRFTRVSAILAFVALIVLAAVIAAYVNVQPLMSRVEETLEVGAGGRPLIWSETLRIVRDFWIAGTGLGSYQTAMLAYQQSDRAMFFNQAHNQYLHLLAEGGVLLVIPAAAATVAFAGLVRTRLAQDTSATAWIRIGSIVALVAVAVQGIWETGLRIPANGLLFAVAAAVAVHRPPAKSTTP